MLLFNYYIFKLIFIWNFIIIIAIITIIVIIINLAGPVKTSILSLETTKKVPLQNVVAFLERDCERELTKVGLYGKQLPSANRDLSSLHLNTLSFAE